MWHLILYITGKTVYLRVPVLMLSIYGVKCQMPVLTSQMANVPDHEIKDPVIHSWHITGHPSETNTYISLNNCNADG